MCKKTNSFIQARKKDVHDFLSGTDVIDLDDDFDEEMPLEFKRTSVKAADIEDLVIEKVLTGIKSFDESGGVIKGSAHCITGDPGVGKSTLLTQVACELAANRKKVLYAGSEMALPMVKSYAKRLGPWNEWSDRRFNFLYTDNVQQIINEIEIIQPLFVVVDSLNYIRSLTIDSAANTVPQLVACAKLLHETATKFNCCIYNICHVTKDGDLSGPMAMKHAVDAIWFLKYQIDLVQFQKNGVIRYYADGKNRFGTVQGEKLFRMIKDTGRLESYAATV